MLCTELQLRKRETIGEIFNVVQKVALAESSALESTNKKRDKPHESQKEFHLNFSERRAETFTPLNIPKANLVTVIIDKYGVRDPTLMRPQMLATRDKTKFCGFHRDYGHGTEDCIQLKRAIERLIREGCLKEYVVNTQQQKDKGERVINVITPEVTSIKKIKKRIFNLTKSYLVLEYRLMHREVISFSNEELKHKEEIKITPIILEV